MQPVGLANTRISTDYAQKSPQSLNSTPTTNTQPTTQKWILEVGPTQQIKEHGSWYHNERASLSNLICVAFHWDVTVNICALAQHGTSFLARGVMEVRCRPQAH